MNFTLTGRREDADGKTIIYSGQDANGYTGIRIESRKRHIPHANRSGTWDHTTYFVIKDGREIIERYTLKDAKKYAEELYKQ